MPDPDKTSGGHMHQKTPYKFNAGNGQFLPLSFFPVILNRKSNIFIIHMDDAVIADSDPMGILSKVINHRLCTVKSFLTVRNPFFCCSMKLKLICIPEIFQFIHIFPTKYFGDSPYREKKLRTIIFPLIFRCQSTAEQYHMNVRAEVHFRAPCMKDADITNGSSKVLWV